MFLGLGTISIPPAKMMTALTLPFPLYPVSWSGIRSMSPPGFRAPGLLLLPLPTLCLPVTPAGPVSTSRRAVGYHLLARMSPDSAYLLLSTSISCSCACPEMFVQPQPALPVFLLSIHAVLPASTSKPGVHRPPVLPCPRYSAGPASLPRHLIVTSSL